MPILDQVKRDAEVLRTVIAGLKVGCSQVIRNGVELKGQALEEALESARSTNKVELQKLDLIIESGIIPNKYTSIVTKQTYHPSGEEQKMMAEALPPATHTFFVNKTSRKKLKTKDALSSFIVMRDNATAVTSFAIEHKDKKIENRYPKGAFADRVKQGHPIKKEESPNLAVKIYHKNMFSGNTEHELRIAMRAAYCYRKLGRTGLCFRRNNKQYLITDWLDGVNLAVANQEQIQAMPISRRLIMSISLLRELAILHHIGFRHGDIKPGNVMVNYGELGFVDLDSVMLKHERPRAGSPLFTPRFLPTPQMSFDAIYNPGNLHLKFDEKTDIYQMGLTLAYLFQEVYVPKEISKTIPVTGASIKTFEFATIELMHGPEYEKHRELQKLIKSMVFQEESSLATVPEYIEAFMQVLKTYPDYEKYLDEDRLANLEEGLSLSDGENSFKEIEIELLGYNRRCDAFNKMKPS